MNIKVNVPILHKKANEIVTPEDKDYLQFLTWAKNKDRKWGSVICEDVPEEEKEEEKKEVVVPSEETEESAPENLVEDVPEAQHEVKEFKCDVEGCGKIFGSAAAVRMHKMNGHKAKPEEGNGN